MAQINHLSGHTGSQGALPKTNSRGWCWGSNSALLLLGMCSTTELDPQPPRASLRRYISTSLGLGEGSLVEIAEQGWQITGFRMLHLLQGGGEQSIMESLAIIHLVAFLYTEHQVLSIMCKAAVLQMRRLKFHGWLRIQKESQSLLVLHSTLWLCS